MGMEMRELFSNRLAEINKKEIAALGFFFLMECVCTVAYEYIYSDPYVLFKLQPVMYSGVYVQMNDIISIVSKVPQLWTEGFADQIRSFYCLGEFVCVSACVSMEWRWDGVCVCVWALHVCTRSGARSRVMPPLALLLQLFVLQHSVCLPPRETGRLL